MPSRNTLSLPASYLALLLIVFTCGAAQAANLPSGFTETQLASGLISPTAIAIAPDGRIFVSEQAGRLRVIKNGTLLSTPFVTLSVDSVGERGLFGIAFDPNFASNQYVYVFYTARTPAPHNRVSRFTASGDTAVPGSEMIIFELDNLSSSTSHNGGAIHFGADGKLYIAVGDNNFDPNSQSLANLKGKMLRINSDGTIPTDNPFYSEASDNNRAIWALGLRNPFTFAVQPGTGRIFINDVGESAFEEINDGAAGANYGWPESEGPTTDPRFASPFYAYGRADGCAIVGGAFYNPQNVQFPSEYLGDYFFADLCQGWIRRIDVQTKSVSNFASGISSPVDLAVDNEGRLYYVARTGGVVYRISFNANQSECAAPGSPGVNICEPASGASATSPVHLVASATTAAPFTGGWVYVGSQKAYHFDEPSFDVNLNIAPGTHTITVKAWDMTGAIVRASRTVTVAGGETCAPPSSPGMNLCSPNDGATLSSPVRFLARVKGESRITGMWLYVNSAKAFHSDTDTLDTTLALPLGVHAITVKGWDSQGRIYRASATITVQ